MSTVTSPADPFRRKPRLDLAVQRAVRAPGAPLRPQIHRILRAAQEREAEVTVRLVGETEGLSLNQSWRGQDHATNVLSFGYETGPVVRGDLVLCVPVVEREAAAQGKPLAAHYLHLLVHGMLHLQGYDHENEADAARMEARETAIVTGFGYADPYDATESH